MGGGYGRSSFCSLCTSENYLRKLDFQVLNNGIVGTIMVQDFCKSTCGGCANGYF